MRTLHVKAFLVVACLVYSNGALAFWLQAHTLRALDLSARSSPDRFSVQRSDLLRLMTINPAAQI